MSRTKVLSIRVVDELIKQAELADQALGKGEYWGWMHGMPHAVKDLKSQFDEGTLCTLDLNS